jgi:hypothetical protein
MFRAEKRNRDGLMGKCRECDNARSLAWSRENPEKKRAIGRASGNRAYRANPEKFRERVRERRRDEARRALETAANRERLRVKRATDAKFRADMAARDASRRSDPEHRPRVIARDKLRYAVRSGALVRQPCEKCGDPRSQGHHTDYSKPLDVVWLCGACHGKEHRRAG